MKFLLFVAILLTAAMLLNANAVSAHGAADKAGAPSMSMMSRMMEMMHGNMDKASAVECGSLGDEELMERGEEMMEEMMGHEDHERVEEAMEKDMKDHDDMHTMMGMWATGCVGKAAVSTMMDRYGISPRVETQKQMAQGQFSAPMLALGIILGAIVGWILNQLIRKKPKQ